MRQNLKGTPEHSGLVPQSWIQEIPAERRISKFLASRTGFMFKMCSHDSKHKDAKSKVPEYKKNGDCDIQILKTTGWIQGRCWIQPCSTFPHLRIHLEGDCSRQCGFSNIVDATANLRACQHPPNAGWPTYISKVPKSDKIPLDVFTSMSPTSWANELMWFVIRG